MGFECCHPAVSFLFFSAVIAGTILFQHPVFLGISFACAFVYSIKRNGWKAAAFNTALLPLAAVFALYYSSYTHFGVTVLQQNFIGNAMTLESLIYGLILGLTAAGVVMWFSCVYCVFTTDKVVYLFGRVSPRLSLLLAILLRMIPRIKNQARRIQTAQAGIGKGIRQGNLIRRAGNCLRIFSILITWTVESLSAASESMRSRGGSLRGRTAFSIYRFDNRDRSLVIALFTLLTATLAAALMGQTGARYDPQIILPTVTAGFWAFAGCYCLLCLMPLALDLWAEYRFRKAA